MAQESFSAWTLRTDHQVALSEDRSHLVFHRPGHLEAYQVLPLTQRSHPLKPPYSIPLEHRIVLGTVTLYYTASRARFEVGGEAKWTIETVRFGGTPVLKVVNSAGLSPSVIITLKNAHWPGTNIPADFVATLYTDGGVWRMKLELTWGSFVADVGLEAFLLGTEAAACEVYLEAIDCPLQTSCGLSTSGYATMTFNPSWLIYVQGTDFGQLFGMGAGGAGAPFDAFAIALLTPGMPSLMASPPLRRCLIVVANLEQTDVSIFAYLSDWLNFSWDKPPFVAAYIEAGEQADGEARRVLMLSGSSTTRIDVLFQADLRGDDGETFPLPLAYPVFAAEYTNEGKQTNALLIANLVSGPRWMHTRVTSLQFDVSRDRSQFLLIDLGGKVTWGAQLRLLQTVARPGEGVALPAAAGNIDLLLISQKGLANANQAEVAILRGDAWAHVTSPANWYAPFHRPQDLLFLTYVFLNLRLVTHGPEQARLVKQADPATVLVGHQPQSVLEQAFFEDSTGGGPVSSPPIGSRIAGPSRLAFQLTAEATGLDFTLEQLLSWSSDSLTPRLAPAAITPTSPAQITPTAKAPAFDQTAIEAPWRLFISPDQYGIWKHALNPVKRGRNTELWHTRLEARVDDGRFARIHDRVIRAIWTPGYPDSKPADPFLETSLTFGQRSDLVTQSIPKAVQADRVMLSSLGAWLELRGDWDTGNIESWRHRATLGRDHYVRIVERGWLMPYGHRAVLITITERKIEQQPAGRIGAYLRKRQFLVVRQPEVTYFPATGTTTNYPNRGRETPFPRIRITTTVTPLLDKADSTAITSITDYSTSDTVEATDAFWPRVGGEDFLFHLISWDREGIATEFTAPAAFISRRALEKVPGAANLAIANLNLAANLGRAKRSFGGQSLAFASSATGGDTTLETADFTFNAVAAGSFALDNDPRPLFYPFMKRASVVIPTIRQLSGSNAPSSIVFYTPFLTKGFGSSSNRSDVFLRLEQASGLTFGSGGTSADKAGALLTPSISVGGLSRQLGAIGAAAADGAGVTDAALDTLAKGTFDPMQYFGGALDARLLGGISLKDILNVIDAVDYDPAKIPKWISSQVGDSVTYTLGWKTDALHTSGAFFSAGATLELSTTMTVQTKVASTPSISVLGKLTGFAINLGGVVKIEFGSMTFTADAGKKADVHIELPDDPLHFDGALSFLEPLKGILGLDNFTDPPYLDISTEGVSLGYTLSIPTVSVGIMSMQGLALSAAITLPFTGDPARARFALSSRENPFIITYSIFGGGGFFGLTVGLSGVELLEVSLEFGGNFSLDLGVASGGVHVMVGIYFAYDVSKSSAALTGYLRAGGELDVLGLISISVEFYLGLTYDTGTKKAWGEASMTVEIEVLFFSFDVTLHVRRELSSTSSDPTFGDTQSEANWADYCAAFAA